MAFTLRNGTEVEDRRLDRIPQFDEASRNYPIRGALQAEAQLVSRRWTLPYSSPVLDQGSEGACVGFGVTNDLRFYPVAIRGLDATFAREQIYWPAQKSDPWPGGSYPDASPQYDGTSTLAGVKVAASLGYYGRYNWAFSEPEMALGVGHLGPAIIGVNWYQGMYEPNTRGYLTPTGSLVGGHCLLVIGISISYGYYVVYNSWGPEWGSNGTAKISRADMATLLSQDGDCCIVTERFAPTK